MQNQPLIFLARFVGCRYTETAHPGLNHHLRKTVGGVVIAVSGDSRSGCPFEVLGFCLLFNDFEGALFDENGKFS